MKGDFSRSSYDEKKNYSGVLKQQGRVSLDADWNEQVDIIGHERETRTEDVIGNCGAPDEGDGFGISVLDTDAKDLRVSDGRFYAAGQLCEPRLHTKVPIIDFPASNQVKLADPDADARRFAVGEWVVVGYGPGETLQEAQIEAVEEDGTLLKLHPKSYSGRKPPFGYLQRLLLYTKQVDYPDAPAANPGGNLVYLDTWTRHITAVEDPAIREKALGGPDTATRVQTVSQVKLFNLAPGRFLPGKPQVPKGKLPGRLLPSEGHEYTCCEAWQKFQDEVGSRKSNGRLKTSVEVPPPTDLCHFAARGGYTGLENRLYRVEIHTPGELGTAKFKWSRDNGSVVFPIVEFFADKPGQVRLSGVRKDQIPCLKVGDWVEVTDDNTDLKGEAGTLLQVAQTYDDATGLLVLGGVVAGYVVEAHAKLRRWDIRREAGATPEDDKYPIPVSAGPTELEDGVIVEFAGSNFLVGDYWMFAARAVDGSVEKLNFEPPHGIDHHYCPLALVDWQEGTGFSLVSDCRNLFAPLTAMTNFFEAGGDGQEAGPGDVFPEPLRVVVARGSHPVEGAKVEFKVEGISGQLWHINSGSGAWTTDPCVVTTNGKGIAQVLAGTKCSPTCPPGPIRVTATLEEAPGCTCIGEHAPLCFSLYLADPVIFYGGGDGQSGPAGNELPAKLRIVVAPRAWPDASVMSAESLPAAGPRYVRFEVGPDSGSVVLIDVDAPPEGGVAECVWKLGNDPMKTQRVEAWLMTDHAVPGGREKTGSPIVFSARAETVSFFPAGGDGQETQPGGTFTDPFRVAVTREILSVADAKVEFTATNDQVHGRCFIRDVNGNWGDRLVGVTNVQGIAECVVKVDAAETKPVQVTATLESVPHLQLPEPRPVLYFNGSVCSAGEEPGFHVAKVVTLADEKALTNDTDVDFHRLSEGLEVAFDEAVDKWFGEWFAMLNKLHKQNAPICYVTLDVPFPLVLAESWGTKAGTVVGFQRLALAGGVSLDDPRQIHWTPTKEAGNWLEWLFDELTRTRSGVTHLLTRLVLKGSFIWSQDDPKKARVYLDGDTFGRPEDNHIGLVSPYGDERRGGDFEMWFWLTESQIDVSPPIIPPTGAGEIRLPFNVAVDPDSVVLGRTLVVIAEDGTPVEGAVEVNPDAPDTVVFRPKQTLVPGNYQVVIAGGAEGVKSTGKQILNRERIFNLVVPRGT